MKRLMMTAAALALLTTAATAAQPDKLFATSITSKVLGLSFVYDKDCEKIPGFEKIATTVLGYLFDNDALFGLADAKATQARLGAEFCSAYKPIVEKANQVNKANGSKP